MVRGPSEIREGYVRERVTKIFINISDYAYMVLALTVCSLKVTFTYKKEPWFTMFASHWTIRCQRFTRILIFIPTLILTKEVSKYMKARTGLHA